MKQIFNDYYVTSCGRVWSYKSQRFLKPSKDGKGYLRVYPFIDGKRQTYKVHRLVAETYIPNPNGYDTVDHIDGNPGNNCVNNLQWMSRENNTRKGVQKKVVCIETGQVFESIKSAAESVNRTCSPLSAHLQGKAKKCGGYTWRIIK